MIDFPEPPSWMVSSWTYFFDTEDEAHSFKANAKDDLDSLDYMDYVGADVEYSEDAGSWRLRVDYIDRRPAPPEAA